MPYRVRSPDGELDFPHLADIAQAYAAGLVDPEDEVQEVGSNTWRKARTLPALANTARKARVKDVGFYRDVILLVSLNMAAFYLAFFREGRLTKAIALMLAFFSAFIMRNVMMKAWRKPF